MPGPLPVELSLTSDGHCVVLLVADDGRGMNGAPEGAGIRGRCDAGVLRRRADRPDRLRGRTEVRLVIPQQADRG